MIEQRRFPAVLATADQHKEAHAQWHADYARTPLRWRCGGRCASLKMSLYDFAKRIGDPHEAAPVADWRDYDKPLIHDGKISAIWFFVTPRGYIQVSDYWWNKADELSIRAVDLRAVRWFKRWCRDRGLPFVRSAKL